MKIMIIGDTASGKSTFGDTLSKNLGIKIYHTDLIRINGKGKEADNQYVLEEIKKILEKNDWIIEGNALRADQERRVKEADIIFLFDFKRITTLYNVYKRRINIYTNKQKRIGSHSNGDKKLNLFYYIPYIFKNFPKRKNILKTNIKKYNKKLITFTSYNDINKFDYNILFKKSWRKHQDHKY